jgi:hypothetical protein
VRFEQRQRFKAVGAPQAAAPVNLRLWFLRRNEERGDDPVIAQLEQVFDWVKAQEKKLFSDRRPLRAVGLSLDDIQLQAEAVFRMTPKQCREVVAWCRARGSEQILPMFEEFLVTVNHFVNSSDDSPQHSYLLREFITWADRQFKKEHLMQQADEDRSAGATA